MLSTGVNKFQKGLGDFFTGVAGGNLHYDKAYNAESNKLYKGLYNRSRAGIENDKLLARQAISPEALAGLNLPTGVDPGLASNFFRASDANLNNFAGGLGKFQQNDARTQAMDNVSASGLDPASMAALFNSIASGIQMPGLHSRNAQGTLNKFSGQTTDIPLDAAGGAGKANASLLELLSSRPVMDEEGNPRFSLDGNAMTQVMPELLNFYAQQFGITPPQLHNLLGDPNALLSLLGGAGNFAGGYAGPFAPGQAPPGTPTPPVPTQRAAPADIPDGTTATGPNGEKVQKQGNKPDGTPIWVPIEAAGAGGGNVNMDYDDSLVPSIG